MNKSETITKIAAALLSSQRAMGNATKGSSNPFFKSKFADLNAIREACMPPLNENGITVLQGTTVWEGKPYVETTLLHESGEWLSSLTEIIAPKVNDPQAHGSGVSYARRYGLQSFLCIGAEDDDGEKAHGRGTVVNNTKPVTKVVEVIAAGPTTGAALVGAASTVAETVIKKGFGVKAVVSETKTATPPTNDEWS